MASPSETARAAILGVPFDPNKKPDRVMTVKAFEQMEATVIATTAGAIIRPSLSSLNAVATPPANQMAWVLGDSTAANNGVYQNTGTSGSPVWTRRGDLPYSIIRMINVGAGTPDAIIATSSLPVPSAPGAALFSINIVADNIGPVTINSKPWRTNVGNEFVAGGIKAGGIYLFLDNGDHYRSITDQDVSALVAAAEAAAVAAADYAALARNDVVVNQFVGDGIQTDFPLTVDPGSGNNIRVNLNGVAQLRSAYSLVYVSGDPILRFSEAPPDGLLFEADMGFRIEVGTPAAGSVTYDRIQNISESLRLLGRKSAGAGQVEEISADELRDLFLPVGSVVQAVSATPYVSNAALSANIPLDDTIPQISEGTQVLSVSITPKSAGNKLRIRFSGVGVTTKEAPSDFTWAIFNGASGAIRAGCVVAHAAGYAFTVAGEAEYSPGALTEQTISVRVGAHAANVDPVRMNGSAAARLLGGAQGATLAVEEIKG